MFVIMNGQVLRISRKISSWANLGEFAKCFNTIKTSYVKAPKEVSFVRVVN